MLAEIDRYKGQPIIHKFSFGKDSYAGLEALIACDLKPAVVIYCETGWEALDHYQYMEEEKQRLLEVHGIDIVTVMANISLPPELEAIAQELEAEAGLPVISPMIRRILKYACFSRPGKGAGGGKWCTSALKKEPAQIWIEANDMDETSVMTTGVRREESSARRNIEAWERQTTPPRCWEWRIIAHWSIMEVGAFLASRRVRVHPLYDAGCSRVGCFPCIHAGKEEIERVAKDKRRVSVVTNLERITTELSHGKRGAGYFQSKAKDALGQYPPVPIEQAILWSRTSHGGSKYLLFPRAQESACDRWGWCDV